MLWPQYDRTMEATLLSYEMSCYQNPTTGCVLYWKSAKNGRPFLTPQTTLVEQPLAKRFLTTGWNAGGGDADAEGKPKGKSKLKLRAEASKRFITTGWNAGGGESISDLDTARNHGKERGASSQRQQSQTAKRFLATGWTAGGGEEDGVVTPAAASA